MATDHYIPLYKNGTEINDDNWVREFRRYCENAFGACFRQAVRFFAIPFLYVWVQILKHNLLF